MESQVIHVAPLLINDPEPGFGLLEGVLPGGNATEVFVGIGRGVTRKFLHRDADEDGVEL